jgi:hypothetical protein
MGNGDATNGDGLIAREIAGRVCSYLQITSDNVCAYVEAGIAPATRRAYKADLEHFPGRWIIDRSIDALRPKFAREDGLTRFLIACRRETWGRAAPLETEDLARQRTIRILASPAKLPDAQRWPGRAPERGEVTGGGGQSTTPNPALRPGVGCGRRRPRT